MTRRFIEATSAKVTGFPGDRILLDADGITAMREQDDNTAVYVGGVVFYVSESIDTILDRLATQPLHGGGPKPPAPPGLG